MAQSVKTKLLLRPFMPGFVAGIFALRGSVACGVWAGRGWVLVMVQSFHSLTINEAVARRFPGICQGRPSGQRIEAKPGQVQIAAQSRNTTGRAGHGGTCWVRGDGIFWLSGLALDCVIGTSLSPL